MSVFVQMISSKPPNFLPNLVLWCIVLSGSVMKKDLFAVFKVKVTARAHMVRNDSVYHIFWTADLLALKLGLLVHYHKPECLMEKLDCCVQGQGHSNISSVNECLFRWNFLNHWTFYYQTWYGDASLWARLSIKETDLLSSRSRS